MKTKCVFPCEIVASATAPRPEKIPTGTVGRDPPC